MELDEAIKHCKEKAEELITESTEKDLYSECMTGYQKSKIKLQASKCRECAKEHEQLAEWLEELKEWHIRKEMSKQGRCSVIVQGEPLYITQGHLEALIKYEEEQTAKEALDRIFDNIDRFRSKDKGGEQE